MSAVAHPEYEGLGHSAAMARVYELAYKLASGHASILIEGERGTHAEAVARLIHERSPRARKPFIRVSRPTLTESFIDEQLFGPLESQFNRRLHSSILAEADAGTLFFDEISDFSMATQERLLACVNGESSIRRADGQYRTVDVRLIAASARDVNELMEEGRLLAGLRERLSVAALRIPPLRERRTDIVDLAYAYLKRHARNSGKTISRIAPGAVSALLAHDWPGNVEELDNVIEHAVLLCDGPMLGLDHLPEDLQGRSVKDSDETDGLQSMLENVERTLIVDALESCGGNQAKAAAMLQITERLMGLRVKKYGIDPREYRTNQ